MTTGAGTIGAIQPRSRAVYKVRPGPNAVRIAGRPARGRPQERSASRTSRTVADEQLPCSASTARDASTALGRQAELVDDVEDARAPGVHRPAGDVVDVYAVPLQQLGDASADVAGEHVRGPGRQAHAEAEVGDVPRHVVGGGGVGARRDVEHLGPLPGRPGSGVTTTAAAASENSACATTWSRSSVRRLDVQAGQLAAQQHRRPTAAATKSLTAPRPGIAA